MARAIQLFHRQGCRSVLRRTEAEEDFRDAVQQIRNLVPPSRAYCERSFEPCDEWVEAGTEGVIEAATIVTAAFENLPPPPYAIAYVRLEGISTAMINFVKQIDLTDVLKAAERLRPGVRARVQFIDKPEGRVTDFYYVLA